MGEGRKRRRWKQDCRGFTLVEIIVVLVILAVLAAFTIPAMLGFVNDARGKAYIAEAREIYTAMQSALTETGAQQTNENKITAVKYKFFLQNGYQNGLSVKKIVISPQSQSGEGQNDIDRDVGTKALKLLGNDIIITEAERSKHYANINVDPVNLKVTSVELHKNGFSIILTSGGTTTVTKD